jgi:hypothetical protein
MYIDKLYDYNYYVYKIHNHFDQAYRACLVFWDELAIHARWTYYKTIVICEPP